MSVPTALVVAMSFAGFLAALWVMLWLMRPKE